MHRSLTQPKVLGQFFDEDFFALCVGFVFFAQRSKQRGVGLFVFPVEDAEGAAEAVAEVVLRGAGLTFACFGAGAALSVLLVGGEFSSESATTRCSGCSVS